MHALRVSTAGTVILMLVASLSSAVGAQETEADSMAPAHFTYTLESLVEPSMGDGDGFTREVRGVLEKEEVEASDPRASGLMTTYGHANLVEVDGGGFLVGAMNVALANDGGAWSGTGTVVQIVVEDGGAMWQAVLTGEDGYDGLTLIMTQYYDDNAQTRRGVIVPTDQMPPQPDPVEAVAE